MAKAFCLFRNTEPNDRRRLRESLVQDEERGLGKERKMNIALWVVQGLLALVFLFAGGMKLVLPIEELTAQMPVPGLLVRFIAVAEVLGALGLILPGLLHIRRGLTPLAAAGLLIIMIGATVISLASGLVAISLVPAMVGLLSAFVAYGRWRLVPHRMAPRVY
jgi:uncharacterized membrane protein YphA (DoxX/SURF4 family)